MLIIVMQVRDDYHLMEEVCHEVGIDVETQKHNRFRQPKTAYESYLYPVSNEGLGPAPKLPGQYTLMECKCPT